MTENAIEREIFKYIDENGIPYSLNSMISVNYSKNKYNEDYLSNELKHNLNSPSRVIKIKLPFELTKNEMEKVVLKYISETTGKHLDSINDILKTPVLNGVPYLLILNEHSETGKVSLARKTIPGSLILRHDNNNIGIKTLGKIECINGDFGISDSPIENLGNLLKIQGDFWITKYADLLKLKSLKPVREVGGNLVINDDNIKSLETIEKVNGNLNLRKSAITELGSLKFVGGNFLGRRDVFEKYNFSNIDIKGKIRLYRE
jgi:hypothetical protein